MLYKPEDTPAVEAAKRTFLGRVYLDWGRWAVVRDVGQEPIAGVAPPQLPPSRTLDHGRIHRSSLCLCLHGSGRARPPSGLTGWVYIVDNRDDGGEAMGGREQK